MQIILSCLLFRNFGQSGVSVGKPAKVQRTCGLLLVVACACSIGATSSFTIDIQNYSCNYYYSGGGAGGGARWETSNKSVI